MRESIGAGWLMTIVISFIVLFSGFLALSINYAKAYRIKDGIVERIQKYNGLNCDSLKDIDDYMLKIGYASRGKCPEEYINATKAFGVNKKNNMVRLDPTNNNLYNYCVIKTQSTNTLEGASHMKGAYYKVAVFFSISLPIFQSSNLFMVSGETNYIAYPTAEESYTSCY